MRTYRHCKTNAQDSQAAKDSRNLKQKALVVPKPLTEGRDMHKLNNEKDGRDVRDVLPFNLD